MLYQTIHTSKILCSHTLKGSTTYHYWSERNKEMKDRRKTVREFFRVEVEVDSSSYNDEIENLFPKVSTLFPPVREKDANPPSLQTSAPKTGGRHT